MSSSSPHADRKVALVTGASSGIGGATATRLAAVGYRVYAAARRVDRLAALAGPSILPLPLDVTDDESMVAAIDRIVSEAGRIDVLVNNAGYGSYGALEDVPLAEGRRQFDVNVFGLARLTQLVLPVMRAQHSGHIVNVSSIGGKIWEPLGSWYHATKFAVEGLSDSLRVEVESFGIKVVVIEPGLIRTEWADIAADSLLATSGNSGGAYEDQAKGLARTLRGANTARMTSDPDVVAAAIAKAATSSKPRTRYGVGGGAPMILLIKRLLGDRSFDRFIRRTVVS